MSILPNKLFSDRILLQLHRLALV